MGTMWGQTDRGKGLHMATLLYQGHGSLRLTTDAGHVIYIDPFMGDDELYAAPADLVLVTHQHHDHTSIHRMPHAPGCVVWQNMDAHPSPDAYLTQSFLDGELVAEAVQAYNHHHDPAACVGYLVRVDGLTLYFAGDTGVTDQMRTDLPARNIDYAFLPGDGIYTMTAEEAGEAANLIRARHAVPIHLKPVQPYGPEEAQRFARIAHNALLVPAGESIRL